MTWYSPLQLVELTQIIATAATALHSLYSYVVSIVDHNYAVIFGNL